MILNKKMRDGSFIEMEVDETQGIFLLKHDPKKYSIAAKENEIEDLKIEDAEEEEIPDFEDE